MTTRDNGLGMRRVCRRPFRLTQKGYVWHHLNSDRSPVSPRRVQRCDGAGEPPSHRPTDTQ